MPFDLYRIGQLLKSVREEKRLTFDDVSNVLFIRKRIIEAIESGNWSILPHPVYVKGYVTQYAAFLGILDRVEAESFPKDSGLPREDRSSVSIPDRKAQSGWESRKRIVGAAAMAVIALGFLVFQNLPRPAYILPASDQSVQSTYQTVAGNEYEDQGDKLVLETKKLMIACQERTWVRIVIDGSDKKEFMMNPEEVVVLNAKEKFDLLIGNAGGVRLFYNGKDTGFTGEAGEVKRINLS